MEVGWMWYDNDEKRTLKQKVELAAQKYREKFGHAPNTCFVNAARHSETLGEDGFRVNGVLVRGKRNVLPNYFWLGVEKEKEAA